MSVVMSRTSPHSHHVFQIGRPQIAPVTSVNPAKSSKEGSGSVDVPVAFGGVRFEPGHWVYCDEDGVLVAPRELK